MAKVVSKSIIDCRLSGSIGDSVFYVINNKQYMRAKPVKGSSLSKPFTQAQLDQRLKFGLVVKYLQPLRGFLNEGFKKGKPGSMLPFNAAFGYCIKHSIVGTYPDYRIDYPNLVVSRGYVTVALKPTMNSMDNGKIEFSWEDNSNDNAAYMDDKVMILVYNPSKLQAVSVLQGNYRISKSQVLDLPSNFKGDEVHCWMAFHQSRQSRVSDSVYVGRVVVG